MALFSAKGGSSSSVVTTTSTNDQQSTSFGDLSQGNIALKDSVYNGFTSKDLNSLLSYQDKFLTNVLDTVQANIKSSSEQTASALEAQSAALTKTQIPATTSFFDSVQPVLIISGVIAFALVIGKRIK